MSGSLKWFARLLIASALIVPVVVQIGASGGVSAAGASTSFTGSPSPNSQGEITSMRTRTSRTFAAGRGSYRLEAHLESINYRDDAGDWQAIENTVCTRASPKEMTPPPAPVATTRSWESRFLSAAQRSWRWRKLAGWRE
jgi:hypothetical protein